MHDPDRVHNQWIDTRLRNEYADIDNDKRLLEAAKAVFTRFWKFNNPGKSDQQAGVEYDQLNLEVHLKDAMDETYFWGQDEKARINAYKKICGELDMKKYKYDSKAWRHDAVEKRTFEIDLFDRYWAKKKFKGSHWHLFQEAVKAHRDLALNKFKPLFKTL